MTSSDPHVIRLIDTIVNLKDGTAYHGGAVFFLLDVNCGKKKKRRAAARL